MFIVRVIVDVYFDVYFLGFNVIRVNQIIDVGGVVYWVVSQVVVFELCFESEVYDVAEQFFGRVVCFFYLCNYVWGVNGLVGEIEVYYY